MSAEPYAAGTSQPYPDQSLPEEAKQAEPAPPVVDPLTPSAIRDDVKKAIAQNAEMGATLAMLAQRCGLA